jgi:hypothetical protein
MTRGQIAFHALDALAVAPDPIEVASIFEGKQLNDLAGLHTTQDVEAPRPEMNPLPLTNASVSHGWF